MGILIHQSFRYVSMNYQNNLQHLTFYKFQRVFWALTEGATATALLTAGGKDGLVALQAAGMLSGLPFTFLLCLICVAIWRACRVAAGDSYPKGPAFAISLFDPFATAPYSEVNMKTTGKLFLQLVGNIVIAPYTIAIVGARLNNSKKIWPYYIPAFALFGKFLLCLIFELAVTGMWGIALFFFLGFITMMTSYRIEIRERYGISGNAAEDFFASCFYPACALQVMHPTAKEITPKIYLSHLCRWTLLPKNWRWTARNQREK